VVKLKEEIELKETNLEKELRKLGQPANFKDKLYQKILLKYDSKKKEWKASDTLVWKGWIYIIPQWIGYLLFMALFGFMFITAYKYGIHNMIAIIAAIFLWRINMILTQLRELNKKL